MGIRTVLYAVRAEAVAAAENDGDLGFDVSHSLDIDRAAPMLDYLMGTDIGARRLNGDEVIEEGGAEFRCFAPQDIDAIAKNIKDNELAKAWQGLDWDAVIEARVYPYDKLSTKDRETASIIDYAVQFEAFVSELSLDGFGMISVKV